jgi:hypothetical protein
LLLGAACEQEATRGSASLPRLTVTPPPPSSSPTAGPSVFVLTPVGLNLRAAPDSGSQRVDTLAQGAQLDVQETRTAGAQTWLHVRTHGAGEDGWVLDDSELLIHRPVYQHIDPDGWSILFPQSWTLQAGNPASFTSPAGEDGGATLQVQTAPDLDKLMAVPTPSGREVREEGPIEVYGKTTFLTVYALQGGGYEYTVRLRLDNPARAYLFLYRQTTGAQADTSLFRQLLASAIVS